MYFLLKMGIFQPAMLAYQRVVLQVLEDLALSRSETTSVPSSTLEGGWLLVEKVMGTYKGTRDPPNATVKPPQEIAGLFKGLLTIGFP